MNLIITSIPSICQWFSTSHMGILSMILSVAATLHNCQLLYNSVAHSSTRKVAMNLTKAILSQNLSPYRSTYHHKPHGKSFYWKIEQRQKPWGKLIIAPPAFLWFSILRLAAPNIPYLLVGLQYLYVNYWLNIQKSPIIHFCMNTVTAPIMYSKIIFWP